MSGVIRWIFHDLDTDETVTLPINPNSMSSPTVGRAIEWAWGSKFGLDRMRGFESPLGSAPQWTFGGVILTESHYELLLEWAGRLVFLEVTDHLGRTFKVLITQYDPVERLPTATKPWRADYTMTCQFVEEVT